MACGKESGMYIKLIGAFLIVGSCSIAGFQIAAAHLRETGILKQIIMAMDYMESELVYRRTPLPELCAEAACKSSGMLHDILLDFSKALNDHASSNAESCVKEVLSHFSNFPAVGKQMLMQFGSSAGIFELDGQISSLKAVKQECHRQLTVRQENQEVRLRSYRTLGICAGAALAVILI